MNAKKNKKVLVLLSSVMALGTLGAVFAFSRSEEGLSRATTGVQSSIVFSRESGEFTKIDNNTASVSGTSFTGAKYYAVSRNNADITSTNYVAQFGFGKSADEQYITFSTGATDTSDFEFEAITGIKVTTTSASNQTLYVYYGSSFSSSIAVTANSNPEKLTFSSSLQKLRLGTTTAQTRNITKIELFYDCGVDPEPEPEPEKQVTILELSNKKTIYAQGGTFVKPTVTAYYSDSTHEEVSDAEFSGFDSSALVENQLITVSFGGKSTSYTVSVRPTETSKKISYKGFDMDSYKDENDLSVFLNVNSSTLPAYASGGDNITITPTPKSGISIVEVSDWNAAVEVVDNQDGTFSFAMSAYYDVELTIVYQEVHEVVGIRVDSPKTSYFVDDEFVKPTVYAVYDNDAESVIPTSALSFSGFNSSVAVASQTITVEYLEFDASYTIEILEKGSDAKGLLNGDYTTPQSSNTLRLRFDGEGNGTYTYINAYDTEKYIINFTYEVNGDTKAVTITLDSGTTTTNINGYTSGYRIVQATGEWVNSSGIINSDGSFSIRLWRLSAGNWSQNTDPTTFSK